MIEAIRRYSSSWVVKGLFLVLVLSFVLWGVADVFRPGARQEWAAEIDGTTITVDAFAREYQAQARRIRNEAGRPVEAEELQRRGLPQMVIDRMIATHLLDQLADDLALTVTTEKVTQTIAADQRFRNAAGQFDQRIFQLALRDAGLNEAQYLARHQSDLRRAQIISSLSEALTAPTALNEEFFRYVFEQRSAQYIAVPLPTAAEIASPSATELQAFYSDHAALFTAPEFRAVTAIILDARVLANDIEVSQADVEQAYTERADEFVEPERRSFQQLVFADAASAQEALSRLAAGADMAALAKETLGLSAADIAVNDVRREGLPADLAAAVFAQPVGMISGPLRSALGYHVFKVTHIEPGRVRTLDQVRETLAAALRLERATEKLIDLGNRLDDTLGRGLSLEDAARELGLPLRAIEAIDPSGRDPSGRVVAGLPSRFTDVAFATPRGEESLLTEGDDNTLFVLRVDGVTAAAVKPFETVAKEVAEAWRSNRQAELAAQRAEGLAVRIRSTGDLAALAAAEGLAVKETPKLSRATLATTGSVPRPVAEAMFSGVADKAFVARGPDSFYVGRVATVSVPEPSAQPHEMAALTSQLTEQLLSDLTWQFVTALRQEHDVRINTQALEKSL
jgi:peptidyl-prolyl cis-trans isomerase D